MKLPGWINPVSIGLIIVAAAIGYLGWKIVPVYWQANHVDGEIKSYASEARKISRTRVTNVEKEIIESLIEDLYELGINEEDIIDVYFADQYSTLNVEYVVTVEFLFGVTKTFEFHRSEDMPTRD